MTAPGTPQYPGFHGYNQTGFRIKDILIQMNSPPTSSGSGGTLYGLLLRNCTSYGLSRLQISTAVAGYVFQNLNLQWIGELKWQNWRQGANGQAGANGANGLPGLNGAAGGSSTSNQVLLFLFSPWCRMGLIWLGSCTSGGGEGGSVTNPPSSCKIE